MTAQCHVTRDFLVIQAWVRWARTMIRLLPTRPRIFTETNSRGMDCTLPTDIAPPQLSTVPLPTLSWRPLWQTTGQTRERRTVLRIYRTLKRAILAITTPWNPTSVRPWTGNSSAPRNWSRERFWCLQVSTELWFAPSLPSLLFEWTMMDWTQA